MHSTHKKKAGTVVPLNEGNVLFQRQLFLSLNRILESFIFDIQDNSIFANNKSVIWITGNIH